EEIDRLVDEAIQYHFASVCVAPVWAKYVATQLEGSGVRTCAVCAFPHGTSKSTVKAIEATASVKEGVDEIDVVAHLPYLLAGDLTAVKQELTEIARAARAARSDIIIKVIVESALLMQQGERGPELIRLAAQAVRESG